MSKNPSSLQHSSKHACRNFDLDFNFKLSLKANLMLAEKRNHVFHCSWKTDFVFLKRLQMYIWKRVHDFYRQQEHNQNYNRGRTSCVLERCLCSAFSGTARSGVGLWVSFKSPASILAVSMDIVIVPHGAIWHAGIGFMKQLCSSLLPNIFKLYFFFRKHTEICQSFTGQ